MRLAAAERQHLPREIGRPRGGTLDLLDIATPRILGVQAVSDDVGVAEDGGEKVVEVVGDAAGEPPHGLHLLRVAQQPLQLHPLLKRVVALGDHGGEDLAGDGGHQQEEEGRRLGSGDGQLGDGPKAGNGQRHRNGGQQGDDDGRTASAEPKPGPDDEGQRQERERRVRSGP